MDSNVTLIFDGDCGFCTSVTNLIVRYSTAKVVATPWQYTDLSKYSLTEKQAADQVYLVVGNENFGGHEALAKILLLQKNRLVRFFGKVLMSRYVRWIAKPGYRLVARYRHRLPGGTPACKLPKQ